MPCLHTHTCAGVRKRAHTDTLCRYLVVCVSVALSAYITQCVCVFVCLCFVCLLWLLWAAAASSARCAASASASAIC